MSDNYNIPIGNYPYMMERIDELNRRATKLGCEPIVIEIVREYAIESKNEITGVKFSRQMLEVSVSGKAPKFEGWSLLACIEPQQNGENIVRTVPGQIVPDSYRKTDTHCDHCKTLRMRNEVFVLGHEDGRFVQVGRTCIRDFLGHQSPENIVSQAEWLCGLVTEALSDFEDEGWTRGETARDVEEFLKTVAICIRRLGWKSRKKLEEEGRDHEESTGQTAWRIMTASANDSYTKVFVKDNDLYYEDRDAELANAALVWAQNIPAEGVEDYQYNLGVACRQGFVVWRTVGIIASAIAAYQRTMNIENERKVRKVGVHVGEVGKRTDFTALTVENLRYFESDFGVKTLVRFKDSDGNTLIWWASKEQELEIGDKCGIRGTVKRHGDYNGWPQTELTRVQIKERSHA